MSPTHRKAIRRIAEIAVEHFHAILDQNISPYSVGEDKVCIYANLTNIKLSEALDLYHNAFHRSFNTNKA